MNTPLDQIEPIEQTPATRTVKAKMSTPTKTTHPFLFKHGNICEITGPMLTTEESLYSNKPKLEAGPEILVILGVDNLLFLRKFDILIQVKKL